MVCKLRILCCVPEEYYDLPGSKSSGYEFFFKAFLRMGHEANHYDLVARNRSKDQINSDFLELVKERRYDLVFIETSDDELLPTVLDEAKQYVPTLAWNSDDDVRWDSYSSLWAPHYTFVVTTCRRVYEQHIGLYSNLLLSQWGCTGLHEGMEVEKDLPFSFVGQMYTSRINDLQQLACETGIRVFGRGWPPPGKLAVIAKRLARRAGLHFSPPGTSLMTQEEVKQIWNRSRISFTPLESYDGRCLQIKARVFDMGLSGTVMLCNANPDLHGYYEPEKEFFEYSDLAGCIRIVKWLKANESAQRRVAEAYYRRTKGEHLLEHRFKKLFKEIGLD